METVEVERLVLDSCSSLQKELTARSEQIERREHCEKRKVRK
jgi:hypothetical protein